ncbi:MAG: DUF3006 domain-containing protein [Armatimonadetes bacterium]|nr:DUF3006 domain-containing protein [Armatimonadota bacterium]
MKELRAVVDRIEGAMAVLLVGEDQFRVVIPYKLMPEGTEEGSVLSIQMEIDSAATEDAKRRVRNLINRLSRGED